MPRLVWNDQPAADFAALVNAAPDEALNSPRRSVVPLLDFAREPLDAAARLGECVGVDLRGVTDLIFESAVPVQRGRGKPSFTDLLILSPSAAVCVEAKFTEPEYESVKSWLRKGGDNRIEVLHGWLDLLGRAGHAISPDAIEDLPYQLVHRAASACYADQQTRAMAYLVFGRAAAHYSRHLRALSRLIGPQLSLHVVSCPLEKSAVIIELEDRWDSGERQLGRDVRRALLQGPLFSFGEMVTETARPELSA